MLVKDIVKIERGTLLGGFTIKTTKSPVFRAALNPDKWIIPETKKRRKATEIRTYVFHEKDKPEWLKTLKADDPAVLNINTRDPWEDWTGTTKVSFKPNEPIGVHMGEFYLCRTIFSTVESPNYTLYSKTLLTNGEFVYLVFETSNINSIETELT